MFVYSVTHGKGGEGAMEGGRRRREEEKRGVRGEERGGEKTAMRRAHEPIIQ